MTGDPYAVRATDVRLAADVLGAVPVPRPEVLARVLAGLRDLPDVPATPSDATAGRSPAESEHTEAEHTEAVPLPRRRL